MTTDASQRSLPYAAVSYGLLISVYFIIYQGFYFAKDDGIGADFSLVLPLLLDGFYWFKSSGAFEIPWFSPAFCGGQPFFADPQFGLYSVPQFLSFVIDPLAASFLTLLIFASLGYWGFYLFTRRCFSLSVWPSIAAGGLYLLNGFLPYRMATGHLGYHAITLTPWIALLLCGKQDSRRIGEHLAYGVGAGILGGYWLQSGLATLMIPAGLAVLALGLAHGLAGGNIGVFMFRSTVATLVSAGLSASKISAALSLMEQFPRSNYTMGGFSNAVDAIVIPLRTLFAPAQSTFDIAIPRLTASDNFLTPHEWAYDFTFAPLALLATGVLLIGIRWWRNGHSIPRPPLRTLLLVFCLLAVATIPFLLAWSSPDWRAFLKTVPILKSTSTPFRWIIILIPMATLVFALLLDRVEPLSRRAAAYTVLLLLASVLLRAIGDLGYREGRMETMLPYNPSTIVNAWHRTYEDTEAPAIREIEAYIHQPTGLLGMPSWRNDSMANGGSQLLCYNPLFGYNLEYYPMDPLRPGPVLRETNGHFNIKNPACYVFPRENHCRPGDHFSVDEREKVERFIHYLPWEFERSTRQHFADGVTKITLVLVFGGLPLLVAFLVFTRRSAATKPNSTMHQKPEGKMETNYGAEES